MRRYHGAARQQWRLPIETRFVLTLSCRNRPGVVGVKLIGATAHYGTADLDEGPIIEQDGRMRINGIRTVVFRD